MAGDIVDNLAILAPGTPPPWPDARRIPDGVWVDIGWIWDEAAQVFRDPNAPPPPSEGGIDLGIDLGIGLGIGLGLP